MLQVGTNDRFLAANSRLFLLAFQRSAENSGDYRDERTMASGLKSPLSAKPKARAAA